MTDTTRAAWDGRPENPERDGWHWVRPNLAAAYEPECWQWCAAAEAFARDASDLNDPWFPQCYDYLGPALLPAQVAAAVAAERADFLRLLDLHRWLRTPAPSNPEAYDAWVEDNASAGEEAAKLEAAIRARGPSSALADALR
ncbi:MAG: hypothetical protein KGS47_17000, partial [Chloroflexi bacterium]|nr:hypothetical protein [Chloroflexota bacterium]